MLVWVVLGVLLWTLIAVPATIFLVGATTARKPRERAPGDEEHPIWLLEARDGAEAVYATEDGQRIRVRREPVR